MWAQILLVTILATVCLTNCSKSVLTEGLTNQQNCKANGDNNSEDCATVLKKEKKGTCKKVTAIRDDPLPLMERDLKCVLSDDKFCRKDMLYIKNVLIKSITNKCGKCSIKGKDKAETLKASLITYHPTAWKEFIAKHGKLRIIELNSFD